MKKIFKFSQEIAEGKPAPVQFKELGPGTVEFDLVFFTTAWNRNNSYFQVSDLLRWKSKAEKLMANFNHDLKETGGKYLGNQTRVISIDGRYNDGSFEIYGTVRSSDPVVYARRNEITAPSIELEVDMSDLKEFADGSGVYFRNFEWVGYALLTGLMAGSGDTRVVEMREFSKQFNQAKNSIMLITKEQLVEFLKDEANQEVVKEVFADGEVSKVVGSYTSKTESTNTFTGGDGNTYQVDSKSMYEEVVRQLTGFVKSEEFISQVKASFAAAEPVADPVPAEPIEPAGDNTDGETPEQKENAEFLAKQIADAKAQSEAKAKLSTFELVPEAGTPAGEAAEGEEVKAQQVPSFYAKLQQ